MVPLEAASTTLIFRHARSLSRPTAGSSQHGKASRPWQVRDAEFETEGFLDHIFYHENTAPFISLRLIQRLVTSNPSPRYMAAVSEAFTTGKYAGRKYSGKYGLSLIHI